MALGGFRGHLWFVLGAPDGLLRVVLASVKPISTIKTALPSFDTLFSLVVAVVVVDVVAVVAVLVVEYNNVLIIINSTTTTAK